MEQMEVKQMIDGIVKALDSFGFSPHTVKNYQTGVFRLIQRHHTENNTSVYSQNLTRGLLDVYQELLDQQKISGRYYRKVRKASEWLLEYSLTGNIVWGTKRNRSKIKVNDYHSSVLVEFLNELYTRISPSTADGYIKTNILQFMHFLENHKCRSVTNISVSSIREFLIQSYSGHKGSVHNVVYSLKQFFQYLNKSAICHIDPTIILQKPASRRKKVLPCFSNDEINNMLQHIDRSQAKGKRDYAMIYLSANTGLRAIDIVNLKLSDINWNRNEIHIIQKKSGNSLVLPLLGDTGNAIADYILESRPETESPYVFVRTIAPYSKLSDIGTGMNVIKRYRMDAGVIFSPGSGKGFHAFRRSMGTRMLVAGIPLPLISQVLGHQDGDSSKQYLSLDETMLSECCLGLQGIAPEKEGLL